MTASIVRLDDRRPATSDTWSPLRLYRAVEVMWWRNVRWESLVHDNGARPEVVVEGLVYHSPDWAPVWDGHGPKQTEIDFG